jgi:hypothetical protein
MTAKKALGIVLLWGVSLAAVGGAIGALLGTAAPNYYRSFFTYGHSPDFNPVQMGIGLGVTQGFAAGITIALVGLVLLAWRDMRAGHADVPQEPRPWPRLVLWAGVTLILIFGVCPVAYILGEIAGWDQSYRAQADRRLQTIAKFMDANEFPNVQSDVSSDGQVSLEGKVDDDAKRQKLRDRLALAFGVEEAEKMVKLVKVEPRFP